MAMQEYSCKSRAKRGMFIDLLVIFTLHTTKWTQNSLENSNTDISLRLGLTLKGHKVC